MGCLPAHLPVVVSLGVAGVKVGVVKGLVIVVGVRFVVDAYQFLEGRALLGGRFLCKLLGVLLDPSLELLVAEAVVLDLKLVLVVGIRPGDDRLCDVLLFVPIALCCLCSCQCHSVADHVLFLQISLFFACGLCPLRCVHITVFSAISQRIILPEMYFFICRIMYILC